MTSAEPAADQRAPARDVASRGETLPISLRIAIREMRSGLRGFGIFLLCLILGVAALAGVRSVSSAISEALAGRGQVILGGDAEFSLAHREIGPPELAFLQSRGAVSELVTMRAMVRAVGDGSSNSQASERALVELKAADEHYPLFGELTLDGEVGSPEAALALRDGRWGAVADPILLTRLGVKPGDLVRIGNLDVEIRAQLLHEPDRLSDGLMFGPRLLVSRQALMESGLIQPGTLATYAYRIRLTDNSDDAALGSFLAEIREQFPHAAWRIKSRDNAAPGVQRFVDRLTLFLSLVGLTALFVGGVGIANAVTNFLDGRRRNIGILKCLGAPAASIFQIYLIQVLALAGVGIIVGLVIGGAIPIVLGYALGSMLPLPIDGGIYPVALLSAACFGILVTLAFAVWPLARARDLPAQALFRELIAPSGRWPAPPYLIAIGAILALLVVLALLTFEDRGLTLWYVFGLAAGFAILITLGKGLMWLATRAPARRGPITRLAIGNLYRPDAATVSVVLSLGLGLSLFVTLALVDTNLTRELQRNLPGQAPSFFFLDIQPYQHAEFEERLRALPGTHDTQSVPMLRGTITSVNGTPSREVNADPEVAWVLRGDRGLTYSEEVPANSVVTAGEWWPADYSGEPLVSMAEDAARGLGLDVGDTLTVNVLGREITARIASLRQVEWRSLAMNFVLVFSPNALQAAPHTFLVTVKAPPEDEPEILRAMSDAYPNVTAVRVKEAIDTVNTLMAQLLTAVRGSNALTLLVGILVLAGALATGMRSRIYDAVVLKTFGATRQQLLVAYALEYGLLGAMTALFAIIAGAVASYAIMRFAMESDWVFSAEVAFSTAALATIVTIAAGLITTWSALRSRPGPILRNE